MIIGVSVAYKTGGISPAVKEISKLFSKNDCIKVSFRDRSSVVDMSITLHDIFRAKEVVESLANASKNKKAKFCTLVMEGFFGFLTSGAVNTDKSYMISNSKYDVRFSVLERKSGEKIKLNNIYISVSKFENSSFHDVVMSTNEVVVATGYIHKLLSGEWHASVKTVPEYKLDANAYRNYTIKLSQSEPKYLEDGDKIYDMINRYLDLFIVEGNAVLLKNGNTILKCYDENRNEYKVLLTK